MVIHHRSPADERRQRAEAPLRFRLVFRLEDR
jgi:hypothetical protein